VSTTAQGRDIGLRFGTRYQIYDMLFGIDAEINAASMVIDEKIPPEKIEPSTAVYSPIMKYVLREARHTETERYNTVLRKEESQKYQGELRLDLYAHAVSALKTCALMMTGARPPGRKEIKSKIMDILISSGRAIGCNIAIENSETYFDGSYTLGSFFRHIHDEYKKGVINRDDLKALYHDKFYMQQMFINAFSSLASADYEHGFDMTDPGQGREWTVGRVRDMEKSRYKGMEENLAFHTVLAHDAILATAYMEAFLNFESDAFDKTEDEIVSALYESGSNLAHLRFGPNTRDHFPDIAMLESYAAEKRLARATMHDVERRLRAGEINADNAQIKSLLIGIATARRNMGPINIGNLLDRFGSAFGARHAPVMKIAQEYFKKTRPVPIVHASSQPGLEA
jgi:hypothetical protein